MSLVMDYDSSAVPLVNVGGSGSGDGEFSFPYGVAVHCETGNIYVCDQGNNRVQVLDKEGKLLFKFGDTDGFGKMKSPTCITLRDHRVFVSQSNGGCVLVFDLIGTYITQVGMKGFGNGQFTTPLGVTFNRANGEMYVCDVGNHRVQIFSKEYSFLSQFGHGIVKYPRDVQITQTYICVLAVENPFVFLFDFNYARILQSISQSISKHLGCPYGICIDGAGRYIISDHNKNGVYVFDSEGGYLFHLKDDSIQQPSGVAIDANGRIVLVSYKPCLLVF